MDAQLLGWEMRCQTSLGSSVSAWLSVFPWDKGSWGSLCSQLASFTDNLNWLLALGRTA